MTPDEFRRAGHELVDFIADHRDTDSSSDDGSIPRSVARRLIQPSVEPGHVRAALPEHPPSAPESFDAVMADVERVIMPGITNWQHPGWFAYFPANVSYPSILGERGHARRHPLGEIPSDRRRRQCRWRHDDSWPTRRASHIRASKRGCESPASAPTASAPLHMTSALRCAPTRCER